jgi:hypothetical protein
MVGNLEMIDIGTPDPIVSYSCHKKDWGMNLLFAIAIILVLAIHSLKTDE